MGKSKVNGTRKRKRENDHVCVYAQMFSTVDLRYVCCWFFILEGFLEGVEFFFFWGGGNWLGFSPSKVPSEEVTRNFGSAWHKIHSQPTVALLINFLCRNFANEH